MTNKTIEHLQKRFKSRHGIELSRAKRFMILKQIHNGVASQLYVLKKNTEYWRVKLYDQETYQNKSYTVLFNRITDQITTVLPEIDSPEFNEFIEKKNIPREQLIYQRLTAKERTAESIKTAHERKQKYLKEKRIANGKKQLKDYKNITEFLNK